jgi:hypothetical protein
MQVCRAHAVQPSFIMTLPPGDWDTARAFLTGSAPSAKQARAGALPLLQRLKKYRKDAVEDDTVRKLQKYVRAQNFTPAAVQQIGPDRQLATS